MKHPIFGVLTAAALLVGGVQLGAVASNGQPLLLGHTNTASKTTTMKTTRSKPALKLSTKASVAPLKVTSSAKVGKLNADLVDGKSADELGTAAYTYAVPRGGAASTSKRITFPGLPSGTYLVSYDILATDADGVGVGTDPGVDAVSCYLRFNTSSMAVDRIALSRGQNPATANDIVTFPAPPTLPDYMVCDSDQPFTFGAQGIAFSQQSTVTFVRLDALTQSPPSVG